MGPGVVNQPRTSMRVFAIVTLALALRCSAERPPTPLPPDEQAVVLARRDATLAQQEVAERLFRRPAAKGDVFLPHARTEADVYALLFELRYHGMSAGAVVRNAALPMPALNGSAADWLEQFADVPLALRRAAYQPFPSNER